MEPTDKVEHWLKTGKLFSDSSSSFGNNNSDSGYSTISTNLNSITEISSKVDALKFKSGVTELTDYSDISRVSNEKSSKVTVSKYPMALSVISELTDYTDISKVQSEIFTCNKVSHVRESFSKLDLSSATSNTIFTSAKCETIPTTTLNTNEPDLLIKNLEFPIQNVKPQIVFQEASYKEPFVPIRFDNVHSQEKIYVPSWNELSFQSNFYQNLNTPAQMPSQTTISPLLVDPIVPLPIPILDAQRPFHFMPNFGNISNPTDQPKLPPFETLSWNFSEAKNNPYGPNLTFHKTLTNNNQMPSTSRASGSTLRRLRSTLRRKSHKGLFQRKKKSNDFSSSSPSSPSSTPPPDRNNLIDPFHIPILGIARSEGLCCVCGSLTGRNRIPLLIRVKFWIATKTFIPENNRSCSIHLTPTDFTIAAINQLHFLASEMLISDSEVMTLLNGVTDHTQRIGRSSQEYFEDESSCLIETGFSLQHFNQIYILVEDRLRNTTVRSKRTALGIFLVKMRHDISYDLIGHWYNIGDRFAVSRAFNPVMKALTSSFVPRYLGYDHITRNDFAKEHKSTIANTILGSNDNFAMVLIDGTYLPIEKSTNYAASRRTWSQHKGYRLLKMMIFCAPDGYMLSVDGPFYANAKNNDERIFQALTENQDSDFRNFFNYGDIIIWDRGFRDVNDLAIRMGLEPKMPHFLKKGQKQHPTKEANESRLVTMVRWPIESVNGRIKNKFKFFNGRLRNTWIKKAPELFKICCAFINAFSPPIRTDLPEDLYLGQKVLNRVTQANSLLTFITEHNLIRKKLPFQKLEGNQLIDFPKLSADDLLEITMGVYQLKQAPSYTAEHVKEDGKYEISFLKQDPGIIFIQLDSRHKGQTTYRLFIQYDPNDTGSDSIRAWYCTCPSGARTLGTCAHISSVLWYFGFARHFDPAPFPAEHLFDNVLDAGLMIEENRRNNESETDTSDNEEDEFQRSESSESDL